MPDEWIDITVPIHQGVVVWPGDPVFESGMFADMARGDVANGSWVRMGLHTGTHVDAPLHFIRDGLAIDHIPPDALSGPARVIAIEDRDSIKSAELQKHDIQPGQRVLFKTPNSSRCPSQVGFVKDFVHISADGARHLAERRVRAVGIDYLSVGGFERDGVETHRILLGAGIWLLETLDLSRVEPGDYEMACMTLKIIGAEAAPARAMLRKITSPSPSR